MFDPINMALNSTPLIIDLAAHGIDIVSLIYAGGGQATYTSDTFWKSVPKNGNCILKAEKSGMVMCFSCDAVAVMGETISSVFASGGYANGSRVMKISVVFAYMGETTVVTAVEVLPMTDPEVT